MWLVSLSLAELTQQVCGTAECHQTAYLGQMLLHAQRRCKGVETDTES